MRRCGNCQRTGQNSSRTYTYEAAKEGDIWPPVQSDSEEEEAEEEAFEEEAEEEDKRGENRAKRRRA